MIMVTWSRPRSVKEDIAHTACRSSQRKPRISLNISTIYSTSPSIFQQSFQWIQSSDSYFNNLPLGRKSRRALHSFPCDSLITIFFSVQYFLTLLGYRLLGQLFEIKRKNSKCVSFFCFLFVFFCFFFISFQFHSYQIQIQSPKFKCFILLVENNPSLKLLAFSIYCCANHFSFWFWFVYKKLAWSFTTNLMKLSIISSTLVVSIIIFYTVIFEGIFLIHKIDHSNWISISIQVD